MRLVYPVDDEFQRAELSSVSCQEKLGNELLSHVPHGGSWSSMLLSRKSLHV
jgi:hypothetical protein